MYADHLTDAQKKDLRVTVWDPSVAEVDEKTLEVKPLAAGFTHVTVELDHFSYQAALYVYETAAGQQDRSVLRITPSLEEIYTVSLSGHGIKQIRGMIYYADGSFEESNDFRYQVADQSVCTVDKKGYIRAKSAGTTEVTMKYKGEDAFTVTVTVVE